MNKIFSKNLTKNLLFSLFCVLITSILIMWLIFPQIKTYKTLLAKKQNQERINKEHKTQEDYLNGKLQIFMQDNEKMISMYEHKFDEKNFESFCSKFFNTVSLNYIQDKTDEKYLKYILKVSTNIDSPVYFYDFVKALENYSNIIKVEFPISFKANSSEIEAIFNIKVFSSK